LIVGEPLVISLLVGNPNKYVFTKGLEILVNGRNCKEDLEMGKGDHTKWEVNTPG
jgi:hypothetical protein